MNNNLMLKGFEVELFTGLPSGEHVGISDVVEKELNGFVKEPDKRNLEYITIPKKNYTELKEELLAPRRLLRQWLLKKQLTLIPGSTLSLGNSKRFERSDPTNYYHDFIEKTYSTSIVTTSIHINLGFSDLKLLFAAIRLVRCEASMFLALSASSPFLDGRLTGAHSQRWKQFPLTPLKVPLFLDHSHYVEWVEKKLATKLMLNERHLWTSVRPNGPKRPYEINRLEFRICDFVSNCELLLAITALLEIRVLLLFQQSEIYDPLQASKLSPEKLAKLSDLNDAAVAQDSLDATLYQWRDGEPILCRKWIEQMIEEVMPLAIEIDMAHLIAPVFSVLENGNQAMQWLRSYSEVGSVKSVIEKSIIQMESEEISMTNPEVLLG